MSDSILQVNQIKDKGGNNTGITIADTTANISIGTTLAVNTINEVTSANGVTIDGLSLKDGNVVPANGKGIDFSAVSGSASGSASAVLDDYEEGTWTPAWQSTSASFNYTSQVGNYTKIGNVVFLTILLQLAGAPSGTTGNNLNLSGLPFTSKSTNYAGISIGGYDNFNYPSTEAHGDQIIGRISANNNAIEILMVEDNGSLQTITAGSITGAMSFFASATYLTT